jgi:hypothetical protein
VPSAREEDLIASDRATDRKLRSESNILFCGGLLKRCSSRQFRLARALAPLRNAECRILFAKRYPRRMQSAWAVAADLMVAVISYNF